MSLKKSDRGFQQGDEIPSTYGGHVRVYESSAAMGPHLWVMVECPEDLNNPSSPSTEAVAHLTLENAQLLRDQLSEIIDNHYQLR